MRTLTVPRQDISAKIHKAFCKAIDYENCDSIVSLLKYNDLEVSVGNNEGLYRLALNNYDEGIVDFINHPKFVVADDNYKCFDRSSMFSWNFLFKSLLDNFEVPDSVLFNCFENSCHNENTYIAGLILIHNNFINKFKENNEFKELINEMSTKMQNFVMPYLKAQNF